MGEQLLKCKGYDLHLLLGEVSYLFFLYLFMFFLVVLLCFYTYCRLMPFYCSLLYFYYR